MNCQRKNNEKLPVFVSRLHGISSEHLMIADELLSSPVGEVLEIKLLKSSNLHQWTLTNSKSELIKMAELIKEHETSMSKKFKVSAGQMT